MMSFLFSSKSYTSLEKRKAPAYRQQAQVEPARRLFFNIRDGLACDLEPLALELDNIQSLKFVLPIQK